MDHIVIPFGGECYAFTAAELTAAKAAALSLGFGVIAAQHGTAESERLLTAKELADDLKDIPQSRIEQMSRDGRIPFIRIGRSYRYRRSEVVAALKVTR